MDIKSQPQLSICRGNLKSLSFKRRGIAGVVQDRTMLLIFILCIVNCVPSHGSDGKSYWNLNSWIILRQLKMEASFYLSMQNYAPFVFTEIKNKCWSAFLDKTQNIGYKDSLSKILNLQIQILLFTLENTQSSNSNIVVYTPVFRTLYKVDRNGNFVFKGFNNSKKKYLQWGSTWCYRLLLV